jgi:hypothetical protein
MKKILGVLLFLISINGILFSQVPAEEAKKAFQNALQANEGFHRCIQYVASWLKYADPTSGLIPRNIRESSDFWNAWDAAADNYPFMVLTSAMLQPDFFRTTALKMLKTERRLTSRLGHLPDTYSFSKKTFLNPLPDTSQILFGSAEYMKDGLIPITEWLGKSPWSRRMLEILDDLPELTGLKGNISGNWYGNSATIEVNGDLMQVLARMFWFTGNVDYLNRAIEIAEPYLTEEGLPTRNFERLRIRDHGCEIISGLAEVYLMVSYVNPAKRAQWRPLIREMFDRILEVGRNKDGLFYDEINPVTGEILKDRIADNFGYTLNAYWFLSEIDSIPEYKMAVRKALNALNEKYRSFDWENGSADGFADAIEGALNLYNREEIPSLGEWLDSEIKNMWAIQKSDGMVEGWHGDGNFARTSLMYCLWKTRGILPDIWQKDLLLGAVITKNGLCVSVSAESGWRGTLRFHSPALNTMLPFDYPRINQFQQWFTINKADSYQITFSNKQKPRVILGKKLLSGLMLKLLPGEHLTILIKGYGE